MTIDAINAYVQPPAMSTPEALKNEVKKVSKKLEAHIDLEQNMLGESHKQLTPQDKKRKPPPHDGQIDVMV